LDFGLEAACFFPSCCTTFPVAFGSVSALALALPALPACFLAGLAVVLAAAFVGEEEEGFFAAAVFVEGFGTEAFLTEASAAAALEAVFVAAVVRGFLGFFVPDDATMFRPWFLTYGRRERKV
jgi:hypothetical protein